MRKTTWATRYPHAAGCRLLLGLALAALVAGCAEFRGIPTHGGGKRFDEEELIVSGAIRRALADMDLKELRGRTATLQMDSISHSGGGYVTFPGIQNFNANANANDNTGLTRYLVYPAPGSYLPFSDSRTRGEGTGYGGGVSGSFVTSYNATTLGSDPDLSYLRSSLTMKAQHCGMNIAPTGGDCVLYVLVDVLGTNRSRYDSLLFWSDRLLASCELTYYAQDAKTGQLIFRARHASAAAEYREHSALGFTAYRIDRTIDSVPGTALPVDGQEVAALVVKGTAAKKCVKKKRGLIGLGRLLNKDADEATSATLEPPVRQLLEMQLANARTQMQLSNLGEAQRLIDAVRAVQPDFPGLNEADAELARRRQEAPAPAQAAAPQPPPAPPAPGPATPPAPAAPAARP